MGTFDASPEAIDMLKKTLCFSPEKRITAAQTLAHPYLELLHCEEDEPIRTPLDTADFEFERRKIDMEALREEIFLEALRYNPQSQQQYLALQKKRKNAYDVGSYRLLTPGESQYSSD